MMELLLAACWPFVALAGAGVIWKTCRHRGRPFILMGYNMILLITFFYLYAGVVHMEAGL